MDKLAKIKDFIEDLTTSLQTAEGFLAEQQESELILTLIDELIEERTNRS